MSDSKPTHLLKCLLCCLSYHSFRGKGRMEEIFMQKSDVQKNEHIRFLSLQISKYVYNGNKVIAKIIVLLNKRKIVIWFIFHRRMKK